MPDGFHDSFLAAIGHDAEALSPWCAPARAEAGLSVYRNTIAKGRADALIAQFPSVERIVGAAWLAAAAVAHGADHPPRQASLLAYGQDFPAWLEGFAPAADMPFLSGLARLDWLWTEAHLAADAAPMDAGEVARLTHEAMASQGLTPHPATRFAAFDDGTPSLWLALQAPAAPPELTLGDTPEAMLFVRPGLEIEARIVGAGAVAFLRACAAGRTLADAAVAALTADPGLDLSTAFAGLVAAGAFTRLRTIP